MLVRSTEDSVAIKMTKEQYNDMMYFIRMYLTYTTHRSDDNTDKCIDFLNELATKVYIQNRRRTNPDYEYKEA